MRHAKWIVAILVIAGLLLSATQLFGQDPYKVFNQYRAMAKAGKAYAGAPLKGKVIGFANIFGTLPFCISVENNIKEHLKLAGGDLNKGWISMDNQYDSVHRPEERRHHAVQASRTSSSSSRPTPRSTTSWPPSSARPRSRCSPSTFRIPGSPFMGVDNWKVALMGGHEMAKLIKEKWGGWDGVDMVALGQMPAGGDVTMLRSEGFAAGPVRGVRHRREGPQDRALRRRHGADRAGQGGHGRRAGGPPRRQVKIAVTSINEQTMAGIIAAMQGAGRWDPDEQDRHHPGRGRAGPVADP